MSSPDSNLLTIIGLDNFNRLVLAEEKPILLLCMPRDSSFSSQVEDLERLQHEFENVLKVCFLEEEFLGAFMERYKVLGTPTFLVFSNGDERERLLGQVSQRDLKLFVHQALAGLGSPDA